MDPQHDFPDSAWIPADVAGGMAADTRDLAARLCHLARPYLYEAMGRRLFLATVRELPPTAAAYEQVALALAETALHRAVRLASDEALLGPAADSALSHTAWQSAQSMALDAVTVDALRELRGLYVEGRATSWDG
jgi:hypothetical protein